MDRKIYKDLLNWKNNNIEMPLMVIGARQVGKTYTIKKFCEREFQKYVYINLFENENIVELFERKISVTEKIRMLKIIIKSEQNIDVDFEKTVIFFDEVQESEEIISTLKYFNESDIHYKIICAGSLLGVKLKRMSKPFPVGKVEILYMKPMERYDKHYKRTF